MVQKNGFVQTPESYEFDRAVQLTGYGRFHFELLAVCALSVINVGFQNGLAPYVFPAAQCELGLTSFDVGMLNVIFLVGGCISSFLWGTLADTVGRRKILLYTHLADGIFILICAIIPTATNLYICRFLNGFLIGAPGSIIFTYLAEFQPPKYRSSSVCCCGVFFTMSWLILPLLAYLILPIVFDIRVINFFVVLPWRIFMVVLGVPELLCALWLVKMPESPKFCLAKYGTDESLKILKLMYAKNENKDPDHYPVKRLNEEKKSEKDANNINIVEDAINQIRELFGPSLRRLTFLICFIMFANMFGVFGLALWLPDLFKRFEEYSKAFPNQSVTIRDLSTFNVTSTSDLASCSPSFDTSVTLNTVSIALSSLIFNVLFGFVASRVSVKTIPLVTMILGGIASGSIYFLTSSFQSLIAACIFQAAMITANMTIGNIACELFPTTLVGITLCLCMLLGRVGAVVSNFLFGYFMDSHCEVPIFIVAAIVLLGGITCLFIPNDRNNKDKSQYQYPNEIEISVISSAINTVREY